MSDPGPDIWVIGVCDLVGKGLSGGPSPSDLDRLFFEKLLRGALREEDEDVDVMVVLQIGSLGDGSLGLDLTLDAQLPCNIGDLALKGSGEGLDEPPGLSGGPDLPQNGVDDLLVLAQRLGPLRNLV